MSEKCRWKCEVDKEDRDANLEGLRYIWKTGCENIYSIEDSGPTINSYFYCPGCGKEIGEIEEDEGKL
jgi:hypothetical protein